MTGPTSVNWGALKKTAEDATRPLPNDWYVVSVVKAEAKVASTGSNMISATLEVQEGPHKTRRLFTNFVLSLENSFALGIFFRNMSAFGLDDAFFASITEYPIEQGMEIIAQNLLHRPVRVNVGIRKWQGQDRNECTEFAVIPGGGPVAPGTVSGPAFVPAGPTATPASTPTSTPTSPTATPMTPTATPTTPMTPTTPTTPPPAF